MLLGILGACGNKKTNIDPFASITKEVDSIRRVADSIHCDESPEDPQPIPSNMTPTISFFIILVSLLTFQAYLPSCFPNRRPASSPTLHERRCHPDYRAIRKHVPQFEMIYDIDPLKQRIADSWPDSLDDTCAREEWGWKPAYDLESMTVDMLEKLREKLK